MRQFKIVIHVPTRQPGGNNKHTFKIKTASVCCMDGTYNKNVIYFIYQQKKYQTKRKIENND
jgi:rRNA processing protein Krr1/Pno1